MWVEHKEVAAMSSPVSVSAGNTWRALPALSKSLSVHSCLPHTPLSQCSHGFLFHLLALPDFMC